MLVLMKERFLIDLIASFKLLFSLFPSSLGKEARKRELKKVNKEIGNVYLAFPVLCIMSVIVMYLVDILRLTLENNSPNK